jgi:hypothetical protein
MRRSTPDSSWTTASLGKHFRPFEVLAGVAIGWATAGDGEAVVFAFVVVSFGVVVACGASVAFGDEVTIGTGMAVAFDSAVVGCADDEDVSRVDVDTEGAKV